MSQPDSNTINDGGPAFPASPCVGPNNDLYRPADIGHAGMSLRAYLAGQALAGIMANTEYDAVYDSSADDASEIAAHTLKLADAIISGLNQKEGQPIMSAPYFGDLPQDPQDAARDAAFAASDDNATPVAKTLYETLTLFCSRDETRYVLQKPFNQNGYTYATDGRIMVRVPQLAEVENNIELNYPNITAAWNRNVSYLRGPLEDLPQLPDDAGKSSPCLECEGDGTVTCHCCGSEIQCENCDNGHTDDVRWMQIGDRRHRMIQLAQVKAIGAKISQLQIPENYLYFTNGTIEGMLVGPSDELPANTEWKGGES